MSSSVPDNDETEIRVNSPFSNDETHEKSARKQNLLNLFKDHKSSKGKTIPDTSTVSVDDEEDSKSTTRVEYTSSDETNKDAEADTVGNQEIPDPSYSRVYGNATVYDISKKPLFHKPLSSHRWQIRSDLTIPPVVATDTPSVGVVRDTGSMIDQHTSFGREMKIGELIRMNRSPALRSGDQQSIAIQSEETNASTMKGQQTATIDSDTSYTPTQSSAVGSKPAKSGLTYASIAAGATARHINSILGAESPSLSSVSGQGPHPSIESKEATTKKS